MKRLLSFILALLASGPAFADCALTAAPAPIPAATAPGFCLAETAFCAALPSGAACGCRDDHGDINDYFTAADGTVTVRGLAFSLFDPESFRAFEGDLDGDGRPEVATARLFAISNGLGVASWRIDIAEPGAGYGDRITAFESQDFGPDIFATRVDGAPGCRVLATRWQSGEGDRTWFTGVWWTIADGGLDLGPAGGGMKRRLLQSFERLRLKTIETLQAAGDLPGTATPFAWLSDAKAKIETFEPRASAPPASTATARVVGFERRPHLDDEAWKIDTLVLRDAAGAEVTFAYYDVRIGDAASGRLWPGGYVPGDRAALAGRAAAILPESALNDGGAVVWLY